MNYTIETTPTACTVVMKGAFTFSDGNSFRTLSKELEKVSSSIVFDFAPVEFIDSSALGMMLILREEQQKRGMPLVLKRARGQVRKMFDLSNFAALFTIED